MRPLAATLAFVLATLAWPAARAVPVEQMPDPRPAHAVVDLTQTLSGAAVAAVDAAASRGRAGGELAVAVLPSLDGAVPRTWATALFNRWALDDADRNRGVLIVFALNDRKAEIVVGDGWADTQATTDAIMEEVIVAQMRAGHTEAAVTGAAEAVVDRLLLAAPESGCAAGFGALLPFALVGGILALVRRRFRTPCPNCKATARVSRKVVSPATHTATGLQHITIHCTHCNHASTTPQTLAILAVAASSNDTWSDSGGSSGGGDSSGGGSSGSW
jgi:uncharacterized membrane protein YgcG